MPNSEHDSHDDVWELLEFCASEAFALRSFLEYLRTSRDSSQQKAVRIANWRTEVGLQLGNPVISEEGVNLLRKARGLPARTRSAMIRDILGQARSLYFKKQ